MKMVLYNYDIYPKVVLANTKKTITIAPLGDHAAFSRESEYVLKIFKVDQSNPARYPEREGRSECRVYPDEKGRLCFEIEFLGESEYFINVHKGDDPQRICTLSVYCLAEDMKGRIPLRGDLHMHTCRSDGREAPTVVAANYRGHGYDFFTISDHRRYYPSVEAIDFYKGITDFNIVHGEEIHLPLNDVHYVNFGGSFSINALVTPNANQEKYGDDLHYRTIDGNTPDTMTQEEFIEMIKKRAESVDREYESERLSFAVLEWTHEQIKAGGGLGIFPHPYWLCQMMQLPEDYTEYIYKKAPFDAFEVLGGERYYQHNGFQTGFYYEMKARGIDHPVVGSTDSHGSTKCNDGALICSTVVFAKANERCEIIDAIKSKYSIAVDTISEEYRLVGDFRLMKYASFLIENYFPIHDLACKAEGYYMKLFATGDERAKEILRAMKGQIPEMQKKYFDVF